MIPIIYEKDETAFVSNGLGRLRDCISCIVTEERNGIYECDFEYPVDGANYDLIQIGRIIAVTHDETGNAQPFDIVSFTKPIEGVVTFHCTHMSYRLSYHTIRAMSAQEDVVTALSYIQTVARPACPFTFWTNKTNTGYCASLESVPHSVREVLGGIEGSIIDTYGGEYEWDKWTVKLWAARGQMRDFTIRYGVNMLSYNEEYDTTGCYSSCRPYWTDGTNTVVGDVQTTTGITPSGRDQCVPLDVSDKFETQPTKADVEAMALTVMNTQNPTVPSQTIEVSFVRLQDMGEYTVLQDLMQCSLCDTINVVFPDFQSGGQFKIVKTEWDVLQGKYNTMELGNLSVSLSEALGISNSLDRSSSSGYVEPEDYVKATGTNGGWTYRLWKSGRYEAEKDITTGSSWSSVGSSGMYYNATTITPPTGMTVKGGFANLKSVSQYIVNGQVQVGTTLTLEVHRLASGSASFNFHVTLIGTYSSS